MNYWEFDFIVEPKVPWSDILVAELSEIGFESFVETESGVKAYVSENEYVESQFLSLYLIQDPPEEVNISFQKQFIPAQNWNATWERSFDPVFVGNKLAIVAPFHENIPQTKYKVTIEPKMSFGTGHHQTTRLISNAMMELESMPSSVLDMGSGTGVLAILAELLGADKIIAIDIESWAYENAIENVERNNCNKIEVFLGNVDLIQPYNFDLILANINKNVLIKDMELYADSLNAKGLLMLSGFFTSDNDILVDCAKKFNLALVKTYSEDNWSCLVFSN